MKVKILLLVLFIFPASIFAQLPTKQKDTKIFERGISAFHKPFLFFNINSQSDDPDKSPLKAALLSGLIPGAGQWYAGNKLKALGFVAAEISFWIGNDYYDNQGAEIVAEFRSYADLNWIPPDYFAWTNLPDIDVATQYSHTLPGTKTQQYYEMVGKYDQFLAGWTDSTGDPDESPMRLHYMDMQHNSNIMYKRADRFAQMLVVNRLASAVEAAFSLRQIPAGISAKLRWKYISSTGNISPVASFSYVW